MMRYVPSDKYTIAWFKLAECVAKGEKEKAFGVYRLLMHSLEDQAYAYQLEGDLLDAFQDERAIEKYAHAAHLYQTNNRVKEAITLYKELIYKAPHENRYLFRLIDLCKNHKNPQAGLAKLIALSDELLEKNMSLQAAIVVDKLQDVANIASIVPLYTKVILALITMHSDKKDIINDTLKKLLDSLVNHDYKNQLKAFLSELEQINLEWYERALKYLAEHP